MSRCTAIKPNGERCKGRAIEGSEWCWNHNPDHADERRWHGSKGGKRGGRGRPVAELQDVKRQLRKLADDVMAGESDRGDAAVAGQLLGTYIRAVSVEVKLKEVLELEERIEALEQPQEGGRQWGA